MDPVRGPCNGIRSAPNLRDRDGIEFLQWALPRLHLRWLGFRKVRRQVCKRIQRRMNELGLGSVAAYRAYLECHASEWSVLDALCRVSISCFYRDRAVFATMRDVVFPDLVRLCDEPDLRCWCAGCAGGEEPYTLAILWDREIAAQSPGSRLRILATDTDRAQIERARRASYPPSALRDLPTGWREATFTATERVFTLRPGYREQVEFRVHDVRTDPVPGRFHLVACRNLAFTYFDEALQTQVLARLLASLTEGGFLVIGAHEDLPEPSKDLVPLKSGLGIFRHGTGSGRATGNQEGRLRS